MYIDLGLVPPRYVYYISTTSRRASAALTAPRVQLVRALSTRASMRNIMMPTTTTTFCGGSPSVAPPLSFLRRTWYDIFILIVALGHLRYNRTENSRGPSFVSRKQSPNTVFHKPPSFTGRKGALGVVLYARQTRKKNRRYSRTADCLENIIRKRNYCSTA